MKKIVLTFGLISGAIIASMFLLMMPFHERISGETGMIIGYTSMVAASMLVYFGVRRYRDTVAGGVISFGRALKVGMLILLVACGVYVATWQVVFYGFMPDYIDKYQARQLEKERAKGATVAQLDSMRVENAKFAKMYRNPLVNAAFTFAEPFPVYLLAALISAAMLRRPREARSEVPLRGTAVT